MRRLPRARRRPRPSGLGHRAGAVWQRAGVDLPGSKGLAKIRNFKLLRAGKLPPQQERSSRSSGAAATAEAAAAAAAAADNRGRRYVFVGDNGRSEKDLQAAQLIIDEFPSDLDAVFLHAVSESTQPAPLPEDGEYGNVPIRYFRTYPMAAAKANELGLLSAAAARACSRTRRPTCAPTRSTCRPAATMRGCCGPRWRRPKPRLDALAWCQSASGRPPAAEEVASARPAPSGSGGAMRRERANFYGCPSGASQV